MTKKSKLPDVADDLRLRAERSADGRHIKVDSPRAEADAQRLLHELEVHQIELEMQNAELRIARDEAEAVLEKYTDLYDFAPVGYFTLSSNGTVRLVNLTGARLVGIDRSKLVGWPLAMLVAEPHRHDFQAFLKQVLAGRVRQSRDFEVVVKGQMHRTINMEAQRSPNGEECNVVAVDVTDRKQAEEKVQISEIRYRRLFEAAHDGVLIIAPGTCKITDANPYMTKLLGYPRNQLIGKELYEIGLLKDEVASRDMFQKLKRNHEVRYENLPLESQGGRHQEVEVVANLYQESGHSVIQCNIRDITDRKRAEDALRRNEALFSALIAQAPVGVYVIDAKLCLQQVNPTAMYVFKNIHPLIGRDFSWVMRAIWPRRVADEIVNQFRHTLESGESYQSLDFVERRRDIREKEYYEWQIQRVILPAGEHGVVCFFNNITDYKKAETAQRRLDVLTASNLKLKKEIIRRQEVADALRKSKLEQSGLLKKSRKQEDQLRDLSRRLLLAQEEERKRISRELHDVIAQTLVGVNVHMAALTQNAILDPKSFHQKIDRARRLVEKSVDIVHQFARELRPTVLDDLGLIPALQAYMEGFMEDNGIRVSLLASAEIEQATDVVRTILYRVVQESLANVARHAQASHVEVLIKCLDDIVSMDIKDNGRGFDVDGNTTGIKKNNRLGLLGMKERVEMIGGGFCVKSKPGEHTTISVRIPAGKGSTVKSPSKKSTRATSLPCEPPI